jgi:hypothetical protein
VIGKDHSHALFVDIQAGKDVVLAGYKLPLNDHRRFLPEWSATTAAILDNRPDIQHTCL